MNQEQAVTSNQLLITKAEKLIPGGVNSPVRAFGSVGGSPVFIKSANGAYVTAHDNTSYIDYVGSWGPMILGHADDDVVKCVQETAKYGLSFGAPTILEIDLAAKIIEIMPSIEKIRMVNSGTEATMSALRLARGYTNRNKIVKFTGCYHGHSDSLLVKAGSGLLTYNNNSASSAGVSKAVVQDTLVADFNNLDSVQKLFENHGDDIACIILEPIAGNMNMVMPEQKFLQGLRDICNKYGALLIFDEVMTGFRVALGGAQSIYNVKPDLTTLGKVIGGGMPVGAFGGRADIMDFLSPLGPVYQAGTLSGNPLAMAAGLTTLNKISKPGFYEELSANTESLTKGFKEIFSSYKIPFLVNNSGGMFGFFFTKDATVNNISNFDDVSKCDVKLFSRFFHAMLAKGVYFAASAYEAGFVSIKHDRQVLTKTLEFANDVASKLI